MQENTDQKLQTNRKVNLSVHEPEISLLYPHVEFFSHYITNICNSSLSLPWHV